MNIIFDKESAKKIINNEEYLNEAVLLLSGLMDEELEKDIADFKTGLEALKADAAAFAEDADEDADADLDFAEDEEDSNVDELLLALEKALDSENNED